MTDAQGALLELLKASLFQAEPRFPRELDWEPVFQEAVSQAVVGLAAPAVPPELRGRWQMAALQNQAQYMRILHAQSKLVELFRERGIPMVILKGTAAAAAYPVPHRRTQGDVDFLVPLDRFEEAEALMEEGGYRFADKSERHSAYFKDGIEFEMHYRFSFRQNEDIEPYLAEGIKHAVMHQVDHAAFPALPDEANALVLLDHIRNHLVDSGLGLRQIIDWMMFVHAGLDDAAWEDRYRALFRATGFEALAVTVTWLCKTWLGLPDPITWCDGADERLAGILMQHLFDNGNFGSKRKGQERPVEGIVFLVRKNGFFPVLHHSALTHWPAAKKHPILWPLAWLYQLWRWGVTLLRSVFRKESLRQLDAGKERTDFCKQLGLM